MRRTPNEPRDWTLKPVVRHQAIMGGICAMFIGMAVWFVVRGFQTHEVEVLLGGLAFASLGAFAIASILTARLVLTPEDLVVRVLWRNHWSLPRRRVEIRELIAGPDGPPCGLAIIDIEGGKVVREIPTGQFSASDMRRLSEIFAPRG